MGIEKTESLLDNLFVINDIDLEIPPTQISIQQEDTYWSWKTLRSSVSTKTPTSHGVLNVDTTIIFVPDQLITLHRLLIEIKNSPFVYIHSAYLRQNIWSHLSEVDSQAMLNMAFVVTSVDVASVKEHPGTFQMHLSLRWFNYFPYSIGFRYRSEWATMPQDVGADQYLAQYTIPTVIGKNLKSAQVPMYLKKKDGENFSIQSFSVIKGKNENRKATVDLTSMLIMHAGSEYDLKALPAPMAKAGPCNPNTSNIYKRYINTLQQTSLLNNFGIDLYSLFDEDKMREKYGPIIYNNFTVGVRDSFSVDIKVDADKNSPRIVFGWHEREMPDEVKGYIILKMMNLMHETTMYYEEYIKIEKDASLVDLELEIQRNSSAKIRKYYQEGLTASAVQDLSNINSDFAAGSELSKYAADQQEAKAANDKDGAQKYPSAETAKGLTTPTENKEDYVFYPLFTHRVNNSNQIEEIDVRGKVTSGFGWRWRDYALNGKEPYWQMHRGVDFSSRDANGKNINNQNILINAPLDGVVIKSLPNTTGAGRYIALKHGPDLITRYMHLNDSISDVFTDEDGVLREPKVGDNIKRGQPFAVMGTTGGSTGIHLHFEVKMDNKTVDPMPYVLGTQYDIASSEVENSDGGNEYNKNQLSFSEDADKFLTDLIVNQVTIVDGTNPTKNTSLPIYPCVNRYIDYGNQKSNITQEEILTTGDNEKIEETFTWNNEPADTTPDADRITNAWSGVTGIISDMGPSLVQYSYNFTDLWSFHLGGGDQVIIDEGIIPVDLFFSLFPTKDLTRKDFHLVESGSGVYSLFNRGFSDVEYIDPWTPRAYNNGSRWRTFLNKDIPNGVVRVPIEDLYLDCWSDGLNSLEVSLNFSEKFKEEFFKNGTSNLENYASGKVTKKLSYSLIYSMYSKGKITGVFNDGPEEYNIKEQEFTEYMPIEQFVKDQYNWLSEAELSKDVKPYKDAAHWFEYQILLQESFNILQGIYLTLKDTVSTFNSMVSSDYLNTLDAEDYQYIYDVFSFVITKIELFKSSQGMIQLQNIEIDLLDPANTSGIITQVHSIAVILMDKIINDFKYVKLEIETSSLTNIYPLGIYSDSIVWSLQNSDGGDLKANIEDAMSYIELAFLGYYYRTYTEAVNDISIKNEEVAKFRNVFTEYEKLEPDQESGIIFGKYAEHSEDSLTKLELALTPLEKALDYTRHFYPSGTLKSFSAKSFWGKDTFKIEEYLNTFLPGAVSQETFDALFILAWFSDYNEVPFKQLLAKATSVEDVENIVKWKDGTEIKEEKYTSTKSFKEVKKSLIRMFNRSENSKFKSHCFGATMSTSPEWGSTLWEMNFWTRKINDENLWIGEISLETRTKNPTFTKIEDIDKEKIYLSSEEEYFFQYTTTDENEYSIQIPVNYTRIVRYLDGEGVVEGESENKEKAEEKGANFNLIAKGVKPTVEQINSIEALRDIIAELMKNDWTPYIDRSGVTDVMKRIVAVSYGNPNYYNNLNFNQYMKYIDTNGSNGYKVYLQRMIDDLVQYEPGNIQKQEQLTYYKDIILSRVTGSFRHILSTLPIIGHQYPTAQHLGSIEPNYEFEFIRMPDPGDSYRMADSGVSLAGNLADLKLNGKNFKKIPNSHAFSMDSFMTRLFGSFEETDYRVNFQNLLDVGLAKRIINKRSFSQTIPGSPGLSSLFLSLEETNPYIMETSSYETSIEDLQKPQEIESPAFNERIKEALTKLYHRDYSKDGAVLSYLNKYSEIKSGQEAIDYLMTEVEMNEENAKKYTQIAILSESSNGLEVDEEAFMVKHIQGKSEGMSYYRIDDHGYEYASGSLKDIPLVYADESDGREMKVEPGSGHRMISSSPTPTSGIIFHKTGRGYFNQINFTFPAGDETNLTVISVTPKHLDSDSESSKYFDQITGRPNDTVSANIDTMYEHFASYSDTGEIEYLDGDRDSEVKVLNIVEIMNSIGSPGETSVTGESKNIDVEKYRTALVDTFREVRMNMSEEACGGLPQGQINKSLYTLDDLDTGIIDAAKWKTFFYYSYSIFGRGLIGAFNGDDGLSTFTRSQVQKMNYVLGYDVIDLNAYFASLYLPGVYDNISGITEEEKGEYYSFLGHTASSTEASGSSEETDSGNPLDFNTVGVLGSQNILDVMKYEIALYDKDQKYVVSYLQNLDSEGAGILFSNTLDTISEDKSIIANAVDIFAKEDEVDGFWISTSERFNRLARFATLDGIYARRNKLEAYLQSKDNVIRSYQKMLGDNFMYESYLEEIVPALAPYLDTEGDSSFSKNKRINKDYQGVSRVFSKLFSPRGLMRSDLSYYASGTEVREKQGRNEGYSTYLGDALLQFAENSGRNFTSGFGFLANVGSGGTLAGSAMIGGTSVATSGFLISQAGVGLAISIGSSGGTALGEMFLDIETEWQDNLLLEAASVRGGGSTSSAVDDFLAGSETLTFFDPENTFDKSIGIDDVRIDPTVIKTLDVSENVNKKREENKLRMYIDTVTEIGKAIIGNPLICRMLGIEESQILEDTSASEVSSVTTYPDMYLPKHPYYNDDGSLATNPDFYMWNFYEDGNGAIHEGELKQIEKGVSLSVANSYNHLKRMQGGGIVSKTDRGLSGAENKEDLKQRSTLSHQPEGSSVILNPTNVGYDDEIGTYTGFASIGDGEDSLKDEIDTGDYTAAEIDALKARSEELNKLARGQSYIPNIKLDNFDGNQLDSRVSRDAGDYYNYFQQISSIESMFTTKQGYAGAELKLHDDGTVKISENEGTDDSNPVSEYKSMFDFNSINQLCKDSAVDILAHSRTMRKAFPTFKLFFIEEDEQETRFRNFDDFYTYNGVKEMTINRDRESGIDTAILILQNVSGTLDGTKKNSTVDADYFDPKKKKKKADYAGGNKVDQIFDSLLLRPGINVQLRVGFSNDPSSLEAMISGCITDISWSRSGDLCEIVVQSFGAELHQHIKGASASIEEKTPFPTTHHLLSSMLLSSELKHFGRWEFDDIYQYGESSKAKVDLYRYKRSNRIGWFHYNWADSASSFFFNNTLAIGSAILVTLGVATAVAFRKPGAIKNIVDDAATAAATGVDEGGAVIKSQRVVLEAGRTVTSVDDAAGSTFKIIDKVETGRLAGAVGRQIKGLFNIIRPAALSNGNRNMFTHFNGGGWNVMRSLGNSSLLANNFIGTGMRWLGNAGGANKFLGYSDDVIEGVEKLLRFKNASSIDDVAGFIAQGEKVVESVVRGNSSVGSAGVTKALKATQEALTRYMNGGAEIAEVVKAQQNVLASLNRMNRSNQLDSILNGALTTWNAQGAGISAYGKAIASGTWGAFTNVYVGSVLTGGTVIAASAVVAESSYSMILGDIRKGNAHYKNEYMRVKASMLLEPQDDNIFPPNPMAYIRLEDRKEIESSWLLGIADLIKKIDVTSLVDMTFGTAFTAIYDKFYKQKKKYQEKRVPFGKADYYLNNTTIWSIFQEMTLRHPGWIHAAVPYGHRFQYTKFFGVPSQRYWSKPASNSFVYRSNRLREFLTLDFNTFSLANLEQNWIRLYGKEDWEKAYSKAHSEFEFQSTIVEKSVYYNNSSDPEVNQSTDPSNPEFGDYDQSKQTRVSNPYGESYSHMERTYSEEFIPQDYSILKIRLKNKAMKEYLAGLESRFIPFRRYHIVDSDKNLISNNIISSSKSVVNAVAVHFKDPESSEVIVKEMKASSMLEDYEINQANISEYTANIKCEEMALRYGMGSLIYGMKNMYKGEVMVLGNPRIKPWDICYLFDTYHDMFGPFEVKAVTHIFSHETGFITEIVPNAVVIGNEVSSTPVIDGLKLFLAAVRDKESQADLRRKFNPDLKRLIADGSFGIMDARYGKDLSRKYAELNNSGVNFESIWNDIPAKDKEILKDYTKEEIFEYLTGVSAWQLKVAETLDPGISGVDPVTGIGAVGAGVAMGTISGNMHAHFLGRKTEEWGKLSEELYEKRGDEAKSIRKQMGKIKKWKFSTAGIIAGTGLLTFVGARNLLKDGGDSAPSRIALSDSLLDGDIKYLISSPILFSKFMEQEAVTVIPLIKDGTPIVSGMSLRDPMTFWQNTLGVLTNKLNDEMRGYADRSRMSLKYKNSFYKRFEELNNEVIDDLDKRTMVQDLLVEEGYSKDAVNLAMTDKVEKWFKDVKRSL